MYSQGPEIPIDFRTQLLDQIEVTDHPIIKESESIFDPDNDDWLKRENIGKPLKLDDPKNKEKVKGNLLSDNSNALGSNNDPKESATKVDKYPQNEQVSKKLQLPKATERGQDPKELASKDEKNSKDTIAKNKQDSKISASGNKHEFKESDTNKDTHNYKEIVPKEPIVAKCKPSHNIVFLKTHKTGSSTILNVFQRYTEHHKLSMVLPMVNKGSHLFKWPNKFNHSFVFEHEPGKKYNILANHARFERNNMLEMMSDQKNTKFITILREPVFQLESMFSYFKFHHPLHTSEKDGLWEFFKKTEGDRRQIVTKLKTMRAGVVKHLLKNPSTFDLGHEQWWEYRDNITYILNSMEKDFNFVMISDYMLESLVALKDELCWELEDVVYFTLNKRPNTFRKDVAAKRNTVRHWSRIDYALFDHFNRTLWDRVKKGGERFQRDLEKLKRLNKDMEEKCLDKGEHFDKTQSWFQIEGYKIKEEARGTDYFDLCKQLTRSEIDYTMVLAEKQSTHGYRVPKRTRERMMD